jgi:putative membrane protein
MRPAALIALSASLAAGLLGGATPAGAQSLGSTSAQDQSWLASSMQGDRFEIIGGQLAQTHSSDAHVRAVGRRLIADHTRSLHEAARAAHPRSVAVPHQPTASERWELDMLARLQGAEFDQAYLSLEVKDHEQDISEATEESKTGSDPTVVALARHELGVLHYHLQLCHRAFAALPT